MSVERAAGRLDVQQRCRRDVRVRRSWCRSRMLDCGRVRRRREVVHARAGPRLQGRAGPERAHVSVVVRGARPGRGVPRRRAGLLRVPRRSVQVHAVLRSGRRPDGQREALVVRALAGAAGLSDAAASHRQHVRRRRAGLQLRELLPGRLSRAARGQVRRRRLAGARGVPSAVRIPPVLGVTTSH